MRDLLAELGVSVRRLARSPGFAGPAVLTLALGIGAATAIFTLIDGVILDGLPYPQAERLIRLKSAVPGSGTDSEWQLSSAQYFHLKNEARTLDEIGAYWRIGVNVQTDDGPRRARVAAATSSTLRMIGARPALGRVFDENDDEPGGPPMAVLSHDYWQSRFGGDPEVVGRSLPMTFPWGESHGEIVGVMAPAIELPGEPGAPSDLRGDIWIPYRLDPAGPFYNQHTVRAMARMAPDATLEEAQAELTRLTERLPEVYPDVYSPAFMQRYGFTTLAYALKNYIVGDVAGHLWTLFGAVGLVLLIACANVANLFLVRTETRRRELAIRTALGAGRFTLARHILGESLVLAAAAGGLALVLGFWGIEWLLSLAPATLPRLENIRLDGRILLFTGFSSALVAVALAALAVGRNGRAITGGVLASGGYGATVGRERQRLRGGLIVTQVTLALVLTVGAGLLIESFRRLSAADPGIRPDGVLTMYLSVPRTRYPELEDEWRFYRAVLERVRALPGVSAAGMTTQIPLTGGFGCTVQGFEDRSVYERLEARGMATCAGQEPTSPGYFEAMGIPIVKGRGFTESDNDTPEAGAVVVSRAFAERYWPGEDPIGKGVGPNGHAEPPFYRVVGVAGDVYGSSLEESPAIVIYYPVVPIPETVRWYPGGQRLVIRTELASPIGLLPAIRRAVQDVDPTVPIANAEEMTGIVARSMARTTFVMVLLGIAATVALLLAGVGLYGVIAYLMARRVREIGVRMALGAQARQVVRMVVGSSLKLAAIGLASGLIAALLLTRVMQGLLYGVRPGHPAAYAAGTLILLGVVLLASWLPARRAARVDPTIALRQQ